MEINEWVKKSHENAVTKGFYDDVFQSLDVIKEHAPDLFPTVRAAFISQRLMLITSELGEALESQRLNKWAKLDGNDVAALSNLFEGEAFINLFKEMIKDTFEDELSDSLIRIFDLAGFLNIDLNAHLELKSKYNATRARLHGGKNF